MDNNYGAGIGPMKDGTMMFWRNGNCPIHAANAQTNERGGE